MMGTLSVKFIKRKKQSLPLYPTFSDRDNSVCS